jgi:PPOX class probable F420-dependent enzyme
MTLDPDVVRLCKGKNVATVVTLMPNGQPQASFTWIDCDDDHLLVNTEPQRQRAKNVRRDPRITVLIGGDTPWDWAGVRGHVDETVGGQARPRPHRRPLAQVHGDPLPEPHRIARPGHSAHLARQGQHQRNASIVEAALVFP